jgi:hypothetical protein
MVLHFQFEIVSLNLQQKEKINYQFPSPFLLQEKEDLIVLEEKVHWKI